MLHVGAAPGAEVVDADHSASGIDQPLAQVRTDEARTTGNEVRHHLLQPEAYTASANSASYRVMFFTGHSTHSEASLCDSQ